MKNVLNFWSGITLIAQLWSFYVELLTILVLINSLIHLFSLSFYSFAYNTKLSNSIIICSMILMEELIVIIIIVAYRIVACRIVACRIVNDSNCRIRKLLMYRIVAYRIVNVSNCRVSNCPHRTVGIPNVSCIT